MAGAALRLLALLALAGVAGEWLSPPLSCRALHVVAPRDGGGLDAGTLLTRLGGGVGAALQRLAEAPGESRGDICRARLLGGIGTR